MFKPVYTLSTFQLDPCSTSEHDMWKRYEFMRALASWYEDVDYLVRELTKLEGMLPGQIDQSLWRPLYLNPHAIHWIEQRLNENNHVEWRCVSCNPNAIHLLENHPDKVNWDALARNSNPRAIPLLERFIQMENPSSKLFNSWLVFPLAAAAKHLAAAFARDMDWVSEIPSASQFWYNLSKNPNAVPLLEKHLDKVDWGALSTNPNAIHILEKHLKNISWRELSRNPNAIPLLEKNLDKVSWRELSLNPNAIPLLEKHLDRVCWFELANNPNGIPLLEKHKYIGPDIVYCANLFRNPNAVHLLESVPWHDRLSHPIDNYINQMAENLNAGHLIKQHLDKLHSGWLHSGWSGLGKNPNVAQILGTLDCAQMRANCCAFARELAEHVFHPARLLRLCERYGMDLADFMELIGD